MRKPPTIGVILAGGLSRRMGGGDKTLLKVAGRTLLDHVIARMRPQCVDLIISANGNPARFAEAALAVVPDTVPDHPGPLAGILAALEWAAEYRPAIEWIVSVSGDTPLLPPDLVGRLHEAREQSGRTVACASSAGRQHPVIGLWPLRLRGELRHALTADNMRQVRQWAGSHNPVWAQWSVEPLDPFFNVNDPEDLAMVSGWLAEPAGVNPIGRRDPE
jgi:molybdenum cofactor guanylyltransferase